MGRRQEKKGEAPFMLQTAACKVIFCSAVVPYTHTYTTHTYRYTPNSPITLHVNNTIKRQAAKGTCTKCTKPLPVVLYLQPGPKNLQLLHLWLFYASTCKKKSVLKNSGECLAGRSYRQRLEREFLCVQIHQYFKDSCRKEARRRPHFTGSNFM